MSPPKFLIVVDREYYHRPGDITTSGWTSNINLATKFSLKKARIYVRDWAKFNVTAILAN